MINFYLCIEHQHLRQVLLIFTNEKYFSKTISQQDFDYGLFIKLPIIIVARDFSPSSCKLKRGILSPFAK